MGDYAKDPSECVCGGWAYSSKQRYRKGFHHPACPMGHKKWCQCIRCKRLRGEPDGLPRVVRARGVGPIKVRK